MRILRIVLLSLLALGVAIAVAAPAVASDCGQQAQVQLRRIGHPIWKPVDFHVFTANDTDFKTEATLLLYPLRHQWCEALGIGPGDPHQPPYNHEFEGNLDIVNITDSNLFRVSDFSPPNGVWVVYMTVPDPGTTGSSPDFLSGPIIPNTLFPIHLHGETYRNNQLWDPYLGDGYEPSLQDGLCGFSVDGHSHFPEFWWEDASFGPGGPIPGHYEFRITMTDVTGNGWSIDVAFTVR